jgi:hypothetical protein
MWESVCCIIERLVWKVQCNAMRTCEKRGRHVALSDFLDYSAHLACLSRTVEYITHAEHMFPRVSIRPIPSHENAIFPSLVVQIQFASITSRKETKRQPMQHLTGRSTAVQAQQAWE